MGGRDAYVRGCTGGSSCPRVADVTIESCGVQVADPMEVDEKRRLDRRGEVGIVMESRAS